MSGLNFVEVMREFLMNGGSGKQLRKILCFEFAQGVRLATYFVSASADMLVQVDTGWDAFALKHNYFCTGWDIRSYLPMRAKCFSLLYLLVRLRSRCGRQWLFGVRQFQKVWTSTYSLLRLLCLMRNGYPMCLLAWYT